LEFEKEHLVLCDYQNLRLLDLETKTMKIFKLRSHLKVHSETYFDVSFVNQNKFELKTTNNYYSSSNSSYFLTITSDLTIQLEEFTHHNFLKYREHFTRHEIRKENKKQMYQFVSEKSLYLKNSGRILFLNQAKNKITNSFVLENMQPKELKVSKVLNQYYLILGTGKALTINSFTNKVKHTRGFKMKDKRTVAFTPDLRLFVNQEFKKNQFAVFEVRNNFELLKTISIVSNTETVSFHYHHLFIQRIEDDSLWAHVSCTSLQTSLKTLSKKKNPIKESITKSDKISRLNDSMNTMESSVISMIFPNKTNLKVKQNSKDLKEQTNKIKQLDSRIKKLTKSKNRSISLDQLVSLVEHKLELYEKYLNE
jgi:hypothetical protein